MTSLEQTVTNITSHLQSVSGHQVKYFLSFQLLRRISGSLVADLLFGGE